MIFDLFCAAGLILKLIVSLNKNITKQQTKQANKQNKTNKTNKQKKKNTKWNIKESRKFSFFFFFQQKPAPDVVIYDNACHLQEYCLARAPRFFKNTLFFFLFFIHFIPCSQFRVNSRSKGTMIFDLFCAAGLVLKLIVSLNKNNQT